MCFRLAVKFIFHTYTLIGAGVIQTEVQVVPGLSVRILVLLLHPGYGLLRLCGKSASWTQRSGLKCCKWICV